MKIVVPDYVPGTSFVGYRSFRWPALNKKLLRSIVRDYEWPTASYGGAVAQCLMQLGEQSWLTIFRTGGRKPSPCAQAPGDRCRSDPHPCGIYAYKTQGQLNAAHLGGPIYAEVKLGGKVYRHEHGFRAQYATVSGIFDRLGPYEQMPERSLEGLARIADHYEVPLLHWDLPEAPHLEMI